MQRLYLHSHSISSPVHPNRIYHYQESYETAASAPVIQAIGINGSQAGTPVGACNNLHITPLVILPAIADRDGYTRISLGTASYNPLYVGLSLWSQTAWADSRTAALRLTNAARATVMAQPPPLGWRSMTIATTNQQAPLTATQGTDFASWYVPLHRYRYQ